MCCFGGAGKGDGEVTSGDSFLQRSAEFDVGLHIVILLTKPINIWGAKMRK